MENRIVVITRRVSSLTDTDAINDIRVGEFFFNEEDRGVYQREPNTQAIALVSRQTQVTADDTTMIGNDYRVTFSGNKRVVLIPNETRVTFVAPSDSASTSKVLMLGKTYSILDSAGNQLPNGYIVAGTLVELTFDGSNLRAVYVANVNNELSTSLSDILAARREVLQKNAELDGKVQNVQNNFDLSVESANAAKNYFTKVAQIFESANASLQVYTSTVTLLAQAPAQRQLAEAADTNQLWYWDGAKWVETGVTFTNWLSDLGLINRVLTNTTDTVKNREGKEIETWDAIRRRALLSSGMRGYVNEDALLADSPTENAVGLDGATQSLWVYDKIAQRWSNTGFELAQVANEMLETFISTAFERRIKNLYDPTRVIYGYRYTGKTTPTTMQPIEASYARNMRLVGPIKVTPGQRYTISWKDPVSMSIAGAWLTIDDLFDPNQLYLNQGGSSSSTNITSITVTVPAGYNYLALNVDTPNTTTGEITWYRNNMQIEEGAVATEYEEPKAAPYVLLEKALPTTAITEQRLLGEIQESVVKPLEVTVSPNMLDLNTVVLNSSIGAAGVPVTVSGSVRSDFIAVKENTTYSTSNVVGNNRIAFYNADAQLISFVTDTTFTTPATTRFLRMNVSSLGLDDDYTFVQLEEGLPTVPRKFGTYAIGADKVLIDDTSTLRQFVARNKSIEERLLSVVVINDSRNLFDKSKFIDKYVISNPSPGVISPSTWAVSSAIPIVGGRTYTISGRSPNVRGVVFSTTASPTGAHITTSYNGAYGSTVTLTAPQEATFMYMNVKNSTDGYEVIDTIQVEEGFVATEYTAYAEEKVALDYTKLTNLPEETNVGTDTTKPHVDNLGKTDGTPTGSGTINTFFDGQLMTTNFSNTRWTANIHAPLVFATRKIDGTTVYTGGSRDSAAQRLSGGDLGGSFTFYSRRYRAPAHERTSRDIGSVWLIDNVQCVLARINDENNITFIPRASSVSSPPAVAVNTLTHVSGANNSTAFATDAHYDAVYDRIFVRNHKVKFSIDGGEFKEITESVPSMNFNSNIKFIETYDFLHRDTLVDWLILNAGAPFDEPQCDFYFAVTNIYRVDTAGNITTTNDVIYGQDVAAATSNAVCLLTSPKLQEPVGTTRYYIPDSGPAASGSVVTDFSKFVDMSTFSAPNNNTLLLGQDTWADPNVPPSRVIMRNELLGIGYAVGYLPFYEASPNIRANVNSRKAVEVSSSTGAVRVLMENFPTSKISKGAYWSAISYKNFFVPDAAHSAHYIVATEDKGSFVFFDWHDFSGSEIYEIPEELYGRELEIVERSDNVRVANAHVATSRLFISVELSEKPSKLVVRFK